MTVNTFAMGLRHGMPLAQYKSALTLVPGYRVHPMRCIFLKSTVLYRTKRLQQTQIHRVQSISSYSRSNVIPLVQCVRSALTCCLPMLAFPFRHCFNLICERNSFVDVVYFCSLGWDLGSNITTASRLAL